MEELFTWDSVGWKLIIPLRLGLLQRPLGVLAIERVESGKQLEKLLRLVGNFVHLVVGCRTVVNGWGCHSDLGFCVVTWNLRTFAFALATWFLFDREVRSEVQIKFYYKKCSPPFLDIQVTLRDEIKSACEYRPFEKCDYSSRITNELCCKKLEYMISKLDGMKQTIDEYQALSLSHTIYISRVVTLMTSFIDL
ncbi:Mediator of RNA polymerase II transcription subunit 11, partial [Cucurbita argyrosperma subsp. argyrosperma]